MREETYASTAVIMHCAPGHLCMDALAAASALGCAGRQSSCTGYCSTGELAQQVGRSLSAMNAVELGELQGPASATMTTGVP